MVPPLQPLDIAQTRTTPRVVFAQETRTLIMQGESYPENSFQFFGRILAWTEDYLTRADGITLSVDIPYMNSSSTKCMLDLLDRLADAHVRGIPVRVVWTYDPKNPRALDLAKDFEEEVTLPFDIVPSRG
ncbi:MAG: DUF1987 domain-containing protein [Myxococcales bacterium]|jgi:hypothetical protein